MQREEAERLRAKCSRYWSEPSDVGEDLIRFKAERRAYREHIVSLGREPVPAGSNLPSNSNLEIRSSKAVTTIDKGGPRVPVPGRDISRDQQGELRSEPFAPPLQSEVRSEFLQPPLQTKDTEVRKRSLKSKLLQKAPGSKPSSVRPPS